MSEDIFLTPFGFRAAKCIKVTAMKTSLVIPAVLLIVMGLIWFLQGINVLPGSFMTGDPKWAVIGGACVVIGIGLIVAARLMR